MTNGMNLNQMIITEHTNESLTEYCNNIIKMIISIDRNLIRLSICKNCILSRLHLVSIIA